MGPDQPIAVAVDQRGFPAPSCCGSVVAGLVPISTRMDLMTSLFDRTISRFRRAFRRGAGINGALPAGLSADLSDLAPVRDRIERSLRQTNPVTARVHAAELGEIYLKLDDVGKSRFLELLAADFAVDDVAVTEAITAYQEAAGPEEKETTRLELRDALRPPAARLLTLFNGLEQGTKFVVDLRADLRQIPDRSPTLVGLDRNIAHLLRGWFDIGFLELRAIDWNTSAAVLEKLIEYEAVHEIAGWTDLRNRMSEDRRNFAFFHPQMPDEPLIFVEGALVEGMADLLPILLDPDAPLTDPTTADTAIFYSISNCQAGLAGIPLGDFLIKRVVARLSQELTQLERFATLSPISGFRSWLLAQPPSAAGLEPLLPLLSNPDEFITPAALEPFKDELMRSCARYLLQAKRADGQVEERVAHFHLSNGARIERVNWMANPSPSGMERAFGMMVNYRYDLDHIDSNHERYISAGEVPHASCVSDLI